MRWRVRGEACVLEGVTQAGWEPATEPLALRVARPLMGGLALIALLAFAVPFLALYFPINWRDNLSLTAIPYERVTANAFFPAKESMNPDYFFNQVSLNDPNRCARASICCYPPYYVFHPQEMRKLD